MDLIDKYNNKEFKKTGETKRLTVQGVDENLYPVYAIPIDYLYYNDQNGRINTTYMKYKSENDELRPEHGDSHYNKVFEKFIYESNKNALKKTLESIKDKGQQEPGVVLPDGRIIDGNRRFTAVRMRQNTTGEQQFFNAIILPLNHKIKMESKLIKTLELDLQLGREEKVDYDPIDRIYDVYHTVELTKQMTPQEYRIAAGFGNTQPVTRDLKIAQLIIRFINIISPCENPAEKFYLARDLKLDGPIKEIDNVIDKLKSPNKESIIDAILIHMILTKTSYIKNEPTKSMRDLKTNVIDKPDQLKYYLDAVDEKIDIIIDGFEDNPISEANDINVLFDTNEELAKAAEKMVKSTNSLVYKGGLDTKRTLILSELIDIRNKIENVNTEDFDELKVEERIEARQVLSDLKDELYRLNKGFL